MVCLLVEGSEESEQGDSVEDEGEHEEETQSHRVAYHGLSTEAVDANYNS